MGSPDMGATLLKNFRYCGDGHLDRARKHLELWREFAGKLNAPVHDGMLGRGVARVKVACRCMAVSLESVGSPG